MEKSPPNQSSPVAPEQISSLGERVTYLRKRLGLSQSALADAVGMSQQGIAMLERNQSQRPRMLPELASALRTTDKWLLDGGPLPPDGGQPQQPNRPLGTGFTPPPSFFHEHDLPVFGAVEGGPGEMVVSTDPVNFVPRPWFLRTVREGYAVIVTGESMSPVLEPGDMVLVNPKLPPVPHKQAIFIEGEDQGDFIATVKRFLRATPTDWIVQQFNPPLEFNLPKSRYRRALRIVGKYDGG